MKFSSLDPVTMHIEGYHVTCEHCGRVGDARLAKVADLIRREHFTTTRHNAVVDPVFAETMPQNVRVSYA